MHDPFRLTLEVQHADGSVTRWGPDELDNTDIPSGLDFTTILPGGFGDLGCELLRRIDLDRPDQNVLDTVTVYAPGNEIVWQGRFTQFPRKTGDGFTISPGAEGWCAHLRDDPSFRMPYVDRDLGSLEGMPLDERLRVATAGYDTGILSWQQDIGGLSVSLPAQSIPGSATAEVWYRAPAGCEIDKIQYAGTCTNVPASFGGTVTAWFQPGDVYTGAASSVLTLDGTLRTADPAGSYRTCALHVFNAGTAITPTSGAMLNLGTVAFYGNHSVPLRDNGTEPDGVYASDVLAHALPICAPLLDFTTGTDGSIEPTSTVLSHLTFPDLTNAEEVVKKVNAVHLKDWFVWEDRRFYFQASDPDRCTWTVRLGDGAHLADDGPAAQEAINKVWVLYTDPQGRQRIAGPTGETLECDVEDDGLKITDPAHPVNAQGLPTKGEIIRLTNVSTDDNAVGIGTVFLSQRAVPQRRGEAVISGLAEHPTQGPRPCYWMRTGHYVQFVDTLDDSISDPRRIIHTQYEQDRRQATLKLDSIPYTLDSLLELLGAELVGSL